MTEQERIDEETRFIEIAYDLFMEGETDEDRVMELAQWMLEEEMGR